MYPLYQIKSNRKIATLYQSITICPYDPAILLDEINIKSDCLSVDQEVERLSCKDNESFVTEYAEICLKYRQC